MNQKFICILVSMAFLISVQNVVAPLPVPDPDPDNGGGGGGGGSKQVDLKKMLKAVQDGKKNDPKIFEEYKNLLWKDPITNESYILPTVLLYYDGNNTTISRTEPVKIMHLANNNLPEMRRMLDLYLEVKEPGSNEYRKVNFLPNKIQANEYSEKTNQTQRVWNDIPSFAYLKKIGEVRLRVNASDGVNKWSSATYKDVVKPPRYRELVFNLTNSLPIMSDFNITPVGLVRYNDPIEYKAIIEYEDGDMLNVTLHILDENDNEIRNETINTRPGPVSFKANEYGFFTEDDAGKNFTYYYSYDDGIDFINKTPEESGPNIKRGAKLFVDRLDFSCTSENYYWWEKYGFSIRAKNLNPEEYDITFALSTKTDKTEWKDVETKTEKIGPNPVVLYFNQTKPFLVTDANHTFSYRIRYSEYDQNRNMFTERIGAQINAKMLPYKIRDPIVLANLFPMMVFAIIMGLLLERILKRGIEAQEAVRKERSNWSEFILVA